MKNRVTLPDLIAMSDAERASLPIDMLWELQRDLADEKAKLETHSDAFYRAISARYEDTFEGERDRDTGIVHIADGNFRISQDVKKNVRYDQKKLNAVLARLEKKGEDVREYVETTHKIPERKWAVWPAAVRKQFEASRQVQPSRPSYKIEVS